MPSAPPPAPACVWAGVLVPRQSIEVHAPAAGEVLELPVELGQHVEPDVPLAILHDPELGFDLVDAHAALIESRARGRRAQAQLERRRQDAVSSEQLARAGHVSAAERADATLELDAATLDRAVAKAAEVTAASLIRRLDGRREQHVMQAPWPARVASRYVDVGAHVERGMPLLRLVDDGPPAARFGVSPASAKDLSPGAIVRVRVEGEVELDARVRHIGTVQDLGTLVVSVDADILDPPSELRAGLAVWAWRPGHTIACGLPAVSEDALQPSPGP